MTDEEKKAIEWLKLLVKTHKLKTQEVTKDEVLLNLIEKQQKEIKELKQINNEHHILNGQLGFEIGKLECELKLKDKVIDEMAEKINVYNFNWNPDCFIENVECEKQTNCNECIKQYFINKVKENKE